MNKEDPFSPARKDRSVQGHDFNTMDVMKTPKALNKESLRSLHGTESRNEKDNELREYAESLKSGVMSANRRLGRLNDDDQKSLNRFPSI